MKLVIIESPYGSDDPNILERNINYAEEALLDSLKRGEAPLASHLLYTRVLNDKSKEERKLGMEAGWAWMRFASLVAFYVDYGISNGMKEAQKKAFLYHIPTEPRKLYTKE